jgi:hypothetical protein
VFGEGMMLIFGHRFIKNGLFYHVLDIESITNTPPSSTLYVEFSEQNLDIINHITINSIPLALGVDNITQVIYASSLGASFIITPKELAKTAQDLANNYLFDAKIVVKIDKEDEIEEFALLGVDGVLFANAIIKINS